MKTGTCTLEIDGEKYYYKFRTSSSKKGAGVNGIDDGVIYIQGRRMEAEEGTKYEPFEYDGKEYLINTSGKNHEEENQYPGCGRCVLLYG